MIDTSNKEIQSHYEFIVVGAGAAGWVLAAELSESGAEVLVIESGGHDDAATISNPSTWFYNVAITSVQCLVSGVRLNQIDWKLRAATAGRASLPLCSSRTRSC